MLAAFGVAPAQTAALAQPALGVEAQRELAVLGRITTRQAHVQPRMVLVVARGPVDVVVEQQGRQQDRLELEPSRRRAIDVWTATDHHRDQPEQLPLHLADAIDHRVVALDRQERQGPERDLGLPDQATTPTDHLLGFEGVPARKLDLAVHAQTNRPIERCARLDHPPKPALRDRGQRLDAGRIEAAERGAIVGLPERLEGLLTVHGRAIDRPRGVGQCNPCVMPASSLGHAGSCLRQSAWRSCLAASMAAPAKMHINTPGMPANPAPAAAQV